MDRWTDWDSFNHDSCLSSAKSALRKNTKLSLWGVLQPGLWMLWRALCRDRCDGCADTVPGLGHKPRLLCEFWAKKLLQSEGWSLWVELLQEPEESGWPALRCSWAPEWYGSVRHCITVWLMVSGFQMHLCWGLLQLFVSEPTGSSGVPFHGCSTGYVWYSLSRNSTDCWMLFSWSPAISCDRFPLRFWIPEFCFVAVPCVLLVDFHHLGGFSN